MVIAEAEYILFYDNTINTIHMEEVDYEQFISYNYSPN